MFQNEKLQVLVEMEKKKIKTLDDEHALELNEWRDKLACRKEVSKQKPSLLFNQNHCSCNHHKSEFQLCYWSV